jgi:hypothetical protein
VVGVPAGRLDPNAWSNWRLRTRRAISEALHTQDLDTVLSYGRLPSGAVRVVAGSPVSPYQRHAIAALGERWPDARMEETGPLR